MAEQAIPEELERAKEKLRRFSSKQAFADLAQVSRATVQKFFAGKPIGVDSFRTICKALELDWEETAGLKVSQPQPAKSEHAMPSDIDALVQELREKIQPSIQQRCGTMRVLRVGLVLVNDLYVRLSVVKFPNSHSDKQNAQSALEILKRYSKIMLLGKPGSGKTTLLRSLAVECFKKQPELEDLKQYVPVFLILKDIASEFSKELDSQERLVLVKAIQWRLQPWGVNTLETVENLLSNSKMLLMLDGLDEVPEKYGEAIVSQLRQLCQQYGDNRIIITCRTQQQEYRFDSDLEDVEINDFDSKQVQKFVHNWFDLVLEGKGKYLALKLIRQLEEPDHQSIAKLAVTPLLLNLICVIALRHQGTLPKNRASLYEDATQVLLTEWDEFEGKKHRQRRSNLSVDEKETLLTNLAWILFEQSDCLPEEQKTLERLVIEELKISKSQAKTLLKSFETEHGLLIEHTPECWSFSHPTFHEYFAAKFIVGHPKPEFAYRQLVIHVTKKRWREIFLLMPEMLRNADAFLQCMKAQVDKLLPKNDKKLQQFLAWDQQKSASVNSHYKPAAIRAFYFDRACTFHDALTLDNVLIFNLDHARSFALVHALDYVFNHLIVRHRALGYNFNCALDCDLDLDLVLAHNTSLGRGFHPPDLYYKLLELKNKLLDQRNQNDFNQWWQTNGQSWIDQLRAVMIEYCNIGHDWQFNAVQRQLLQQYYEANLLLVNCLNNDYVSREVREEIEETLLLPIEEIERRKKEEKKGEE